MVKSFDVFCQTCKNESKPHIIWHAEEAFTFVCYNCGNTETCSMDYREAPKDVDEYDKLRDEKNREIKENIDRIIEKKLN